MIARFNGFCEQCGKATYPGDSIRRGNFGWIHSACHPAVATFDAEQAVMAGGRRARALVRSLR